MYGKKELTGPRWWWNLHGSAAAADDVTDDKKNGSFTKFEWHTQKFEKKNE